MIRRPSRSYNYCGSHSSFSRTGRAVRRLVPIRSALSRHRKRAEGRQMRGRFQALGPLEIQALATQAAGEGWTRLDPHIRAFRLSPWVPSWPIWFATS